MTNALAPFRLRPTFSPRPWGRRDLKPWYTLDPKEMGAEPIGESWLTGPQAVAETGPLSGATLAEIAKSHASLLLGTWEGEGEFPLLLKLLFPDDKLSVQVHPNDEQAQAMGQRRGKTECWYTLAAEPGAAVACGLKPGVTPDQVRASVADNSMEDLLNQIELHVGDMIFVDAGTVHAIGPGLTLLETQQTSDITYRMYDYGRPRELHLEQGIAVVKTETGAGPVKPQDLPLRDAPNARGTRLIQQHYFTVDRFDFAAEGALTLDDAAGKPHCIVTLEGNATLKIEDGTSIELLLGTATIIPASVSSYTITAAANGFACVRSMP